MEMPVKLLAKQEGVLEIDLHRGVAWFTPTEGKWAGVTTLRICGLPKNLNIERDQHDVTVTNYIGKEGNDND